MNSNQVKLMFLSLTLISCFTAQLSHPTMKIDLINGAYLEIGGELGRYHSLPIDVLIKISQDLQDLIKTIAKYELPDEELLNPDNFIIEIVDFKKGSAVPAFAFSQRSEYRVGPDCTGHRIMVNEKFEKIAEIANSGDYKQLIELYPEPYRRNPIVENVYDFVNDFKTSPVTFVDYNKLNDTVTPIYKLNKFKAAAKRELMGEILDEEKAKRETEEVLGKVRISKTKKGIRKKVLQTYPKDYSMEYAPEVIICESTKYFLTKPLRCLFQSEENYYVIQCELLDLIGTGDSKDEAEVSFNEEFDYLYEKLNSLDDQHLSKHNQFVKSVFNNYVERVES